MGSNRQRVQSRITRMNGPQVSILNKGGHITQWQPFDQPSGVLFCSALADLHGPKAVRGGIPVCWPWFGPRQGHAQHGFVRTMPWQMENFRECEGVVYCTMVINSSEDTFALWPYRWKLELKVAASNSIMDISLISHNLGQSSMPVTQALHTYFAVGDIHCAVIEGLQGKRYIDKTRAGQEFEQLGDLMIAEETDRIYLHTRAAKLVDPVYNREIEIVSEGGNAMVVWNPWEEKCKTISDLNPSDYSHFVCIESACTPESLDLLPGQHHELNMRIKVNSFVK